MVGMKRLYQSQSPLVLGWRSDRGSRTLCPSMAHSSSDGHVGCIVWPQVIGSRKNAGIPSQCLVCPEVAISQRIHLWEGKSTSNQPCRSSNASWDHCGQEPWALVALWEKANVVTTRTFQEHVWLAVGCPGGSSWRPGEDWCWCSISVRSWLFPLGDTRVVFPIQGKIFKPGFWVAEKRNLGNPGWEKKPGKTQKR